jgi:NADP-dependent 3-hydroxy acid dehydrogenase YdfG
VDPGLVETDFSRVRFRGDEETASKVYQGVEAMQPEDIAECVLFAVTRPPHVNVDELVVKALAQSSGGRILRSES